MYTHKHIFMSAFIETRKVLIGMELCMLFKSFNRWTKDPLSSIKIIYFMTEIYKFCFCFQDNVILIFEKIYGFNNTVTQKTN